jgi:methyltransferase-like protein
MIPENYGAQVAQQLRSRSGNDLVETEQFFDLLSGRTFRNTILVSAARLATANRALRPESLAGLHFVTQAGMHLERDGEKYVVIDAAGRTLTTTSGVTADALARLVARFPSSSSLDDCVDADADTAERAALLDALYQMLLVGMVTLSSEPVEAGTVTDRPKAIPLARVDAAEGAQATTNLRHETITLDPAARCLLPMLDGRTDHATLARRLAEEAAAGQLGFLRDGRQVTDPEELAAVTQEHLPALLASIAHSALLDRS